MLSIVKSMALHGLEGYLVEVQVDVSAGLPHYEVVGLPDTTVKESKERVRAAIKNSGINFPSRRIIVNLAPANTKKEGSIFDLPISIGILVATEIIQQKRLEGTILIGELSLDGKLNQVKGILPICIEAYKLGITKVILPKENAKEAAVVEGLQVIPAENLIEVIEYLNDRIDIKEEKIDIKNIFENNNKYNIDFSEVKGQENAKRALEIASAGGHNCLLIRKSWLWKNNASKKINNYITRLKF